MSCFPCLNPRRKENEKMDKPRIEDDINIPSATRDSGLSPGICMLSAKAVHLYLQNLNLVFFMFRDWFVTIV